MQAPAAARTAGHAIQGRPPYLNVAFTVSAAVRAAINVAAGLGVTRVEPVVLADGANVIVHLTPSPVVAKVAASTTEIRPDTAAWLQRELDVASFLAGAGIPVLEPSPEIPAATYHGDGHVMSFWRYLRSAGDARPSEATVGSMLRDLHAALRSYPGEDEMPVLAPLSDIPAFLARPQTRLTAGRGRVPGRGVHPAHRGTRPHVMDRADAARGRWRGQPHGRGHRMGLA